MRGDERQPAVADGEAARTRRGPRHAAPRKSLLTKLQAPAGKALALAAMPTAVLVGISLTPRPALADEKDIPFAPGPCVTQSDEPAESQEPKPSASTTASPSPSPSPSATASPDGGGTGTGPKPPVPTRTPSADAATKPAEPTPGKEPQAGTTAPAATPSPAATPAPTPSASRHPLDPLGVGGAVKDLLGGLAGEQEVPAPTPSAPTAAPAPLPSATATAKPPVLDGPDRPERPDTDGDTAPGTKPGTGTVDGTGTGDATKDAIKDAADEVGAEVEELPEDVKGREPKKDEDVPDGAKPPFPCPTPDPRALADAEPEPGVPHVADHPWRLESTRLTLRGLKYHGIVEVRTGSGTLKKALKFTASEVDIKDLHQLTVHGEGRTGHVTSRPGSTSTITGGTVTMYTEKLKGNLFGLIPITFSPETPPPLDVPYAFFTDVEVVQAAQFGGTLKVPGLKNFIEG
ncbi:hypothetical protein ACF053_13530 [Streptomyces kanasensis]|uniref:hypothetical protein n=1 Tax=Streptomyces kanasensis TaxID=936756 RepID=UPI00370348CF